MARLFVGSNSRTGGQVALKILEAAELDDSTKSRFRLEARALCLLHHPHVVRIHDYGETADGSVWIAMELLEGRTLHDEIQCSGALTAERALDLTEQVLRGVAACHEVGILHRDLKPSNIFLTRPLGFREDQVKLIDLGLAKELDVPSSLTSHGCVVGTMTYMSPEHGAGGMVDERSDLYSVGVVLREMLYGRADPTAPDQSTPAGMAPVTREVQELLDSLLAFEPRARPASALEAIDQVRAIRARLEGTLRVPEPTAMHLAAAGVSSPSGPSRRAGWMLLALSAGALAYAFLGGRTPGAEPVSVVAVPELATTAAERPEEASAVVAPADREDPDPATLVSVPKGRALDKPGEAASTKLAKTRSSPEPGRGRRSVRRTRKSKKLCPKGVTLSSVPSSASVRSGSTALGKTPLVLPAGRRGRRLTVIRDGYRPRTVVVDGSRCTMQVELTVRDPTSAEARHASAGSP